MRSWARSDPEVFSEKPVLGRRIKCLVSPCALLTDSVNNPKQVPGLEQASTDRFLHSVNVLSSVRHILTLNFSLLAFDFRLTTPHKKKCVDYLSSEMMNRKINI